MSDLRDCRVIDCAALAQFLREQARRIMDGRTVPGNVRDSLLAKARELAPVPMNEGKKPPQQ